MSATLSPLLALRAGILTRLGDDAPLATLMGGVVRLYDEPPRGAAPVYALFGDGEVRDDSVQGARRHRHTLALHVIAKPGSTRTALAAARDERTGEARATLTFAAVTELLATA